MDAPENNSGPTKNLDSVLRYNAELVDTVQRQQKTIEQLREELALYRRKLFGKSSERYVDDESQLRLFEVGDEEANTDGPEDDLEEDAKPKRRRRKKKSEKIPDHLKRRVIEADVSGSTVAATTILTTCSTSPKVVVEMARGVS